MKTGLSQILWVVDVKLVDCNVHTHHAMAMVIARRDSDPPTPGHSKSGWIIDRFALTSS